MKVSSQNLKIKKESRLQVRIDDSSYQVLERAARYKNETLSRFIRNESLRAAQKIVQKHEHQKLSDVDWTIFFNALISPDLPNENLKKAFARFKENK
ncbi:MAG: hypothetical protein B7Y25_01200 [Alphaproteobacteria bacterium 16-39-46]|nr:MAG: hypothetical protein B7Y25_01200 [Alphaproteobacteria bacterium 16-39-46]OZA44142.1 MAG: hypothetical protein B7X84_01280 [Alphaproteobacteria bacterium 17-39-52]HQS83515.1 DUF1778 domain-containing protein [Alphaproteobacteria bacterium]HQS93283.1 DUF1778 domain-containing protein [Alphaproteobacteria bacterium]